MLKYISHYQKAAKDIVYFVENFLNVKLYPYQKGILWSMVDNDKVLVNSCRQSGKTSCIIWYSLWKALFRSGSTIGIMGLSMEMNKWIIQDIVKYLGDESKDLITNKTQFSIKLNDSEIVTFIPNNYETFLCGRRITDILWDEIAHSTCRSNVPAKLENFCKLTNAKYHIVSTKSGTNDYFYKKYVESKHPLLNESGFKSIAVNWWDIPTIDSGRKDQIINQIGLKNFNNEYLSDF